MEVNSPRSILVVDNDPSIVAMLELVFSQMGFVPHGASSVAAAL